MHSRTLKQNLIILLAIPLVGLLFCTASTALNKARIVQEM